MQDIRECKLHNEIGELKDEIGQLRDAVRDIEACRRCEVAGLRNDIDIGRLRDGVWDIRKFQLCNEISELKDDIGRLRDAVQDIGARQQHEFLFYMNIQYRFWHSSKYWHYKPGLPDIYDAQCPHISNNYRS